MQNGRITYCKQSGDNTPLKAAVIAENPHGGCTPCVEQINKTPHKTSGGSQVVHTSWYARLSAEKKEEHLNKQWIARQQKNCISKPKYI
jgi:hypothetical protein